MANRYNTPAQAQFVDYTQDLPFQELMSVGATMASRADKARQDLSEYMKAHSEFNSLSNIDNEQYAALTTGRLSPIADEMAANPDLIKTAEGRARIQSAINGGDYAAINRLKTSADNMNKLKSAYEELAKKGQLNPFWHNTDFANYDTSKNGIFSQVSATPYQTLDELSDPIMSQVKPVILPEASDKMYKRTGISEAMIRQQADGIANNLATTEAGRMHMQEAIARGYTTAENAPKWLADQLFQRNAWRAGIMKEEVDPLQMERVRSGLRMAEFKEQMKWKDEFETKKAERAAAKKNGKEHDPHSKLGAFTNAHTVEVEAHKKVIDRPIIPEYKNEISNILSIAGVPKSSIDALINTTTANGFNAAFNQIKQTFPGGEMPIELEIMVKGKYSDERLVSVQNEVMDGQRVLREFSVNLGEGAVLDYYKIGELNKAATARKKVNVDKDTGEEIITTPINNNALRNGFILSGDDRIAAMYTPESMSSSREKYKENRKTTGTKYGTWNSGFPVLGSQFASSATTSSPVSNDPLRYLSEENAKKVVDKFPNITQSLISYAGNVDYATDGTTTRIGSDNGNTFYALGEVHIPIKKFEEATDKIAKDLNIPAVSGKDLRKLWSSDFGDGFGIGEIKKFKSTSYNKKDSPESDSEVFVMKMATPIFNDAYSSYEWNASGMKDLYGTSENAKNANYGQSVSEFASLEADREPVQNIYMK